MEGGKGGSSEPVRRLLSRCKMMMARSKVVEWRPQEVVGFWLNSEG